VDTAIRAQTGMKNRMGMPMITNPFEELHLFIAQHTVAMREQLPRKKKLCKYYTTMKPI